MRLTTLVLAGLLALSFAGDVSAGPAVAPVGEKKVEKTGSKTAKREVPPRPSNLSKGKVAGKGSATSHLGSAARQALLAKRMEQAKKGATGKKDSLQTKAKKRVRT